MRIKYNRTSTLAQKGQRFNLDTTEYSKTINDFGVSGKIEFKDREGGKKLISLVEEGVVKEIIFEDLSRVGRTLKDSINTLDYFTNEKNILVTIRNIGIASHTPDGTSNPMWKLVTSILCTVYDMERERILELTSHGRQAYILAGGKMGRPKDYRLTDEKFMNKEQTKNIIRLIRMGKSTRDITSRVKCSPNTVTKVKKILKTDKFNHLMGTAQKTNKSNGGIVSDNPPSMVIEDTKVSDNPPSLEIEDKEPVVIKGSDISKYYRNR